MVHHATLPLVQALTGCVLDIQALDGRLLRVPVTTIVTPGATQLVKGEGMPTADGKGRGDLHIVFDLLFPVQLNERQRTLVKARARRMSASASGCGASSPRPALASHSAKH